MANQLQLRKGSASPIAAATVITDALAAEPFFNTSDGGLYVAKATGSAGFAFIGGGDTIAPNTSSTGAELKLRDGGASDYISIRGSSAMTATYSAVMPAAIGSATQFLELNSVVNGEVKEISALTAAGSGYANGPASNVGTTGGTGSGLTVDIIVDSNAVVAAYINNPGSGYTATDTITITTGGANATFTVDKVGDSAVLAWGSPAGGFSNFSVDDGTTSDTINSGDALTIAGGDGITSTLTGNGSAAPTITLVVDTGEGIVIDGGAAVALDINGLSNTETTLEDADLFAIHEATDGRVEKIAASNAKTYFLDGTAASATTAATATEATNVTLGSDVASTDTHYLVFSGTETGTSALETNTAVTIQPSSGNIATDGNLTVKATVVSTDAAANIFDTTATTVNAFGAATTANIGYDGTAASTTNIATGATAAATTNAINIGTGATASGAVTTITLGSDPTQVGQGNSTVVVQGDLQVTGTTTTVDSTTVTIADLNITLASGAANAAAADGAGLTIDGAGATWTFEDNFVLGNAEDAWRSSEHMALAAGKDFFMANGTIQVLEDSGAGGGTQVTLRNTVVDGGTY